MTEESCQGGEEGSVTQRGAVKAGGRVRDGRRTASAEGKGSGGRRAAKAGEPVAGCYTLRHGQLAALPSF